MFRIFYNALKIPKEKNLPYLAGFKQFIKN